MFGSGSFDNQGQDFGFDPQPRIMRMSNVDNVAVLAESYFLETFVPSDSVGTPAVGEWMVRTFDVAGRAESLEKSLSALTITRLGRQKNDLAMVLQGRTLYGQALRSLQRALWHKDLVLEDQTLAASQILKAFEVRILRSKLSWFPL